MFLARLAVFCSDQYLGMSSAPSCLSPIVQLGKCRLDADPHKAPKVAVTSRSGSFCFSNPFSTQQFPNGKLESCAPYEPQINLVTRFALRVIDALGGTLQVTGLPSSAVENHSEGNHRNLHRCLKPRIVPRPGGHQRQLAVQSLCNGIDDRQAQAATLRIATDAFESFL